MKTSILVLLTTFTVHFVQSQEVFQHHRLTRLWETQTNLKTTESVLYDPLSNMLFVACINENPWEKDGNGYISKLTADGKVVTASWATGLSAPKGMGIAQGKLYVTNIDEVVEIDLSDGTVIKRYTHPRAVNLNDIAVSSGGTVYISDSKGDCLFILDRGRLEILSDSPEVAPCNGLYMEKEQLLCGQQNRVVSLNLQTLEASTFIDNTGGIDGIESIGMNRYLISDWVGHVYLAEPGKEKTLLLDTSPLKINAADIGFNRTESILYVPTFFHNGVAAYRLE